MKKYKIIMKSWGGTSIEMMSDLTFREAYDICENLNWQYDAGYIWDLEIEEE